MAEKKPGFFKRLFKFGKAREEPAPEEVRPVETEPTAPVAVETTPVNPVFEQETSQAAAEAARAAQEAEQRRLEEEAERLAQQAAEEETLKREEEARIEAERLEAQKKAEEEKAAAEQAERERLARKQREEAEAREAQAEAARLEVERAAREQKEIAEREAQEAAQEEIRQKKIEQEKREAERLASEQAQAEREEAERKEAARLERERLEQEQQEQERLELERLAAEKAAEQERLERERKAAEEAAAAKAAEAVAQKASEPKAPPPVAKKSWFSKLRDGLSRSSSQLTENITAVFTKRKLDEDTLQELEDILIQADLGVETAMNITDALGSQRMGKDITDEEVREFMALEIEKVLEPVAAELELDLDHTPHVMLVVGVNGSGKTTTIGKLSQKLYDAGFSTLLVAGDTFRAAAIEQLRIWGERTQSPVVSRPLGSDAAGLAFDAYTQAKEEGRDVMLMDTAGRLQNKTELMAELEKIIRVLRKQDPTAPHTVLLTLDATTGQNALNQVEIFKDVAGVNGLVMTKLDGTARGGIMVAIAARFKLPVYFIGVGEQVDDLEPFEAKDFARSIAGLGR